MRIAKNEICVIVVLFNPTKEQISQIEKISSCFCVAAIDNSEGKSDIKCTYYAPLCTNKGIAAAQNVGIKYAQKQGFKYVLLLDQDSRVDENYIDSIYSSFITIKEFDQQIGYTGPIFIDQNTGKEYKNYTDKEREFTKVQAMIASGTLISLSVIDKVGLMDESLFIDLVDFEWCWRANSLGYNGYMTRNVQMYHSIGKEYHNCHGFVLGISAPFRYFYQYRNTLWLCKRDYVPFRWKVKSILRRTLDLLLVPLVSKEGIKCFKFMTKGIKMGLFYKNTPLYQLYD